MSTHNIVFMKKLSNWQNYPLIFIKYHQIRTLSLLLNQPECFILAGKEKTAKNFLEDIAKLAQNQDKFPALDSKSFGRLNFTIFESCEKTCRATETSCDPGRCSIPEHTKLHLNQNSLTETKIDKFATPYAFSKYLKVKENLNPVVEWLRPLVSSTLNCMVFSLLWVQSLHRAHVRLAKFCFRVIGCFSEGSPIFVPPNEPRCENTGFLHM